MSIPLIFPHSIQVPAGAAVEGRVDLPEGVIENLQIHGDGCGGKVSLYVCSYTSRIYPTGETAELWIFNHPIVLAGPGARYRHRGGDLVVHLVNDDSQDHIVMVIFQLDPSR